MKVWRSLYYKEIGVREFVKDNCSGHVPFARMEIVRQAVTVGPDLGRWANQTRKVKFIGVTKLSPRQMQIVVNREGRVEEGCGFQRTRLRKMISLDS